MSGEQTILMAHGGGGELTGRLVRDLIHRELANAALAEMADSAILARPAGRLCFTTDSYVVWPLFFPGGDIGRLAVCGTVNDLAVMGAQPVALSLGLIIEEGLAIDDLRRIIRSVAAAAREAGTPVVTGDTKVVERAGQRPPGLYINTAGVGCLPDGLQLSIRSIQPEDCVLVTGNLAEHGLAIMVAREGLQMQSGLRSDVAPLNGLTARLIDAGLRPRFMRDPTRGGLAGVLTDMAEMAGITVHIREADLPIPAAVRHVADLLGLDPLTIANEGKCVMVVAPQDAQRALELCRSHPLGGQAALIGRVAAGEPAVILHTRIGGRRVVQRPYGELLPRIC